MRHNRRGHVMSAYMLGLTLAVMALYFSPPGSTVWTAAALGACGFFVYGPLMMVSVAMAGYAGPELAGSASGLGGLCGYAGATLAGVGLGAVAEHFGWDAVFGVLTASSLAAALCFGLTIGAPGPAAHDPEGKKVAVKA